MSEVSDSLLSQAGHARKEHRLTDAQRDLVEAVGLCRKSGTAIELARSLTALGQIERDLQNLGSAHAHYEEAVAIYRSQGDAPKLAHTGVYREAG